MPTSQKASRASILIAGTLVGALGCTFLATFDDPPATKPRDGGRDARPSSTCEGHEPDPDATPCSINRGRAASAYCGCDRLVNYQGSPDDLVLCGDDGGILDVTPCEHGCAFYPPGMADMCDRCNGREDGNWCATELGVDAGKVIMRCEGGRQVQSAVECPGATRCSGQGPDAGCK